MNTPKTPENPPAFPNPAIGKGGMTLRDYFAAAALPGLISSAVDAARKGEVGSDEARLLAVRSAFKLADLMLAEREKGTVPRA